MALMFLNGGRMRGGPVRRHIDGVPLVASEPPELELSIVELTGTRLSFGMILREEEHRRGGRSSWAGT